MRAPDRSASGYRCYSHCDLQAVRSIRGLQGAGFTLRDIRELAAFEQVLASDTSPLDARASARMEIIRRARDRLAALDDRIDGLHRMRAQMEQLIETLTHFGCCVFSAGPAEDAKASVATAYEFPQ